ncbi:MAG: hypothetical protein HQL24_09955 [Candidatus Omnitrophica bacterium]|nr:hypothetical protein [Candidatus Omnitrophota bacterium]
MKRQGDLLIVRVEAIPIASKKKDNLILAEGEATGHNHALDSGEVYEKDGVLYFRADTTTRLNHPEHKQLLFEKGTYKVIRQREYEPAGWRNVAD